MPRPYPATPRVAHISRGHASPVVVLRETVGYELAARQEHSA